MISGEELCLAVGEYAEGVALQVGSADGWPAARPAARADDRLQVLAGFAPRPVEQLLQPGHIRRFLVHGAKYL